MRYIIFLSLFLVACSPKVTKIETITKTDTLIVYRDTLLNIPALSDTFSIDIQALCDSLLSGKSFEINKISSKVSNQVGERKAKLRIETKDGKAQIICHEETWIARYDSLLKTTQVTHETIKTVTVEQCTSKAHDFYKVWFFVSSTVLVVLLGFLIRKLFL